MLTYSQSHATKPKRPQLTPLDERPTRRTVHRREHKIRPSPESPWPSNRYRASPYRRFYSVVHGLNVQRSKDRRSSFFERPRRPSSWCTGNHDRLQPGNYCVDNNDSEYNWYDSADYSTYVVFDPERCHSPCNNHKACGYDYNVLDDYAACCDHYAAACESELGVSYPVSTKRRNCVVRGMHLVPLRHQHRVPVVPARSAPCRYVFCVSESRMASNNNRHNDHCVQNRYRWFCEDSVSNKWQYSRP